MRQLFQVNAYLWHKQGTVPQEDHQAKQQDTLSQTIQLCSGQEWNKLRCLCTHGRLLVNRKHRCAPYSVFSHSVLIAHIFLAAAEAHTHGGSSGS